MPRAPSLDLRVRVLAAAAQGLSHRRAGERFGVSAASVSRWRALERERGEAGPVAKAETAGPDGLRCTKTRSSTLLEATPDMAIEELRQALANKGMTFGYGTIRRFFARHAVTRKKRPRMRPSKTDLTF